MNEQALVHARLVDTRARVAALTRAIAAREAELRRPLEALRRHRAGLLQQQWFLEAECARWKRPTRIWSLRPSTLAALGVGLGLCTFGVVGDPSRERTLMLLLVGVLVALGLGTRERLK